MRLTTRPAITLLPLTWTITIITLTTALPTTHLFSRSVSPTAIAQLTAIAPTSNTCANAPIPSECVTATQAVPPLISSFVQYHIASAAEQAALLAWMAFESLDFKYNHNVYPGTPGQGTRAMLSPTYVKMYAASIPAVAAQAATLTDPNAILALVQPDQYSFAAAAWFLTSQCSADVRAQLQTGTVAGWKGWITGCVQTTVTSERQAYWERAVTALGV